jgi:hypothetical protein
MGADGKRPPVVLQMTPDMPDIDQSRIVSGEVELPLSYLAEYVAVADPDGDTPESLVLRNVLRGGLDALAELYLVAQPQVVLTRRPRMELLCVPSPHMRIETGAKTSTAGVLCRDPQGELGVTGCLHGTGPVGTRVIVDSHECRVKLANDVQDIVFIPLPPGHAPAGMKGLAGVRRDREPARADPVHFDGATNPNATTRIFGADLGLLRARPTVMLKVQTDPDTDEGDSGSALLDKEERVLGFAFERTGFNDYPQFTDWIWAANALASLQLTHL